jgi:hypothetical protein
MLPSSHILGEPSRRHMVPSDKRNYPRQAELALRHRTIKGPRALAVRRRNPRSTMILHETHIGARYEDSGGEKISSAEQLPRKPSRKPRRRAQRPVRKEMICLSIVAHLTPGGSSKSTSGARNAGGKSWS